jgi:hypothetical protein
VINVEVNIAIILIQKSPNVLSSVRAMLAAPFDITTSV